MGEEKQGCCGPVKDRLELIKEISTRLAQGHQMLMMLYRQLAIDHKDSAAEMNALNKAADEQEDLSKRSLSMVVPDGFRFDDEPAMEKKNDDPQLALPHP